MRHNKSAASVNVSRVRKSVAKRVREHHSRNLDTSRASIKSLVPNIGSKMCKKQKKTLVGMCLDSGRGIHSRQE